MFFFINTYSNMNKHDKVCDKDPLNGLKKTKKTIGTKICTLLNGTFYS